MLGLVLAVASRAGADEARALIEALSSTRLETSSPRQVSNLGLETGWATIELLDGVLYPVQAADGSVSELIFLGQGRVQLDPPDPLEASQLELFTGAPKLSETFNEAVLVVARDMAAQALLGREPLIGNEANLDQLAARAKTRYETWKDSPARRQLNLEAGLLADALGDERADQLFAAAFSGGRLGDFLLSVDPLDEEPLQLGQFVPIETSDRNKRRLIRILDRQQRKGRMIGLEINDLGSWDTWVSGGRPQGQQAGDQQTTAPFEPHHYEIDVTIQPRSGKLEARAVLHLRTVNTGHRLVRLDLHRDLSIRSIHLNDNSQNELAFLRNRNNVAVVLPDTPGRDEIIRLAVEYSGDFLDKGSERNWALRDAIAWYPHAGAVDLATYDVTLRHPEKLDLVAGGTKVGGGRSGGLQWEQRRLEIPSIGFSFAIGRFEIRRLRSRHAEVTIAFDPATVRASKGTLHEISNAAVDSLRYYEDTFGRYPLDELVVVTVPSDHSQAMLGFITLSNTMMIDWGIATGLIGVTDRRAVVAHEVAHQWWGHQIGWKSYRDQWISEAMANYAAQLWTRYRLGRHELEGLSPTAGWLQELLAPAGNGRAVADLGPLVLGARLSSSLSTEAYNSIVYRKGAVVLGMLARQLGEERFLEVLRMMIEENSGRVLSTDDFLGLIEILAEVDLEDFSRQFVYGTALPEISYQYDVTLTPENRYRVRIQTTRRASTRYRYTLSEVDGLVDVRRERHDAAAGALRLAVPFQITFAGTVLGMQGVIEIDEDNDEILFETVDRPQALWLDANEEVFARFTDEKRQPKRVLLAQGVEASAGGNPLQARQLLETALRTNTPLAEPGLEELQLRIDRILDARVQLEIARLFVNENLLDAAEQAVEDARRVLAPEERALISDEAAYLLTRVDLRRGNAVKALRRLKRDVAAERRLADAEGCLLTVLAASAADDAEALDEALRRARRQGLDTSGLNTGVVGRRAP